MRKLSNCGGWLDLDTNEVYMNKSMTIIKVHKKSINDMVKPIRMSDKDFMKIISTLQDKSSLTNQGA